MKQSGIGILPEYINTIIGRIIILDIEEDIILIRELIKKSMKVKYLIVGAGISGLSVATRVDDYLIIEKEKEIGGLCKTVKKNGFIWDYSGHFFHFKNEKIKKQFIDNLNNEDIVVKEKNTKIHNKNIHIDFPFQKNIHQLDKEDFINCLYDLYFRKDTNNYENFEQMLYGKFGQSITDMFLKPYNQKLYACNLNTLDVDAMGRFFPYADIDDIIRNMKYQNNSSYNETFLYPQKGAYSFIEKIYSKIDSNKIWKNCELLSIDINKHVAQTTKGTIAYEYLINTIPLNKFCDTLNIKWDEHLSFNKVLVFNMGFDKKSQFKDIHWMYFPENKFNFYRVGFYDNILEQDRLSIYVEIGFSSYENIDKKKELEKVLEGLRTANIIKEHQLLDYHMVVIDPAYVHINKISEEFKKNIFKLFNRNGIYSIGRYGKWTYCSIEDCIVDAIEVVEIIKRLNG